MGVAVFSVKQPATIANENLSDVTAAEMFNSRNMQSH